MKIPRRRQKMKLLKRALLLLSVVLVLCIFAGAADHTAANIEELYTVIFENLQKQDTEFTVEYTGPMGDLPVVNRLISLPLLSRGMTANLPNPDGTGPDVYMMNIREARCAAGENNELIMYFTYLLDHSQLAWVDTQVDSIISELQLDGLSDYMKIKKIYQYMGTNFTYDHTLKKFTDYEGLTTGSMVCQGYALLTYKLLWKIGIPCRIVVGVSSGEQHGWNIVKLEDKWYNLDTTWDSGNEGGPMYWNYFLRAPIDFADHVQDAVFTDSTYFQQQHPMAEESYAVPSIEILIDGVLYSGLTIRNGKTTQLQASLTPEKDMKITWSSSDEAVVSVDENGLISSLVPGAVYITATADDPEYTPGVFPVTAVDLRSCSQWAEEELNSYYLRKLYPAILCSDYQQPITREEFCHLLYQLIASYLSTGGQYKYQGFEDVEDGSPYWFSIVYVASRGIFQGTGEKTFDPTGLLTREQAAKLLCSVLDYAKIPYDAASPKTFQDAADISPWAVDYVAKASSAGLMMGTDTDMFNPHSTLTREEAAVTLERLFVNFIEPNLPKAETPAA